MVWILRPRGPSIPSLPRLCLLDVTFSPPCLGAIQFTLPERRIDRFLILCNTAEPEMNYRDLSTEHLPAFPHMLSLTARFYPLPCFTFHCHLLLFHYLSFLFFIQYFISFCFHLAVLFFRAVWVGGWSYPCVAHSFSLVCISALPHF